MLKPILLLLLSVAGFSAAGQDKCGYNDLVSSVAVQHGDIRTVIAALKAPDNRIAAPAGKVVQHPVPVVFHIILSPSQLDAIGGPAAIPVAIDSQLAILGRDFNGDAGNKASIPVPFQPFFGNAGLSFAPARIDEDGAAAAGYEIKIIQDKGFNIDGGTGSGFGFSSAKYAAAGGADAWDPTSYLNVWVINTLKENNNSAYMGLTVPPSFTGAATGIPVNEQGIVLSYKAWLPAAKGHPRTLTHEAGHYFGLWHIWGDDEGLCPSNGGADDGIADTPPQASPTYGCPSFPERDACYTNDSTGRNGIMFVDFMDYTDDACLNMFTSQQAARIQSAAGPGGRLFSLTQHPKLLQLPSGTDPANSYTIFPNPATDVLNIVFERVSNGLESAAVISVSGQVAARVACTEQQGYYSFDLSGYGTGIYFVRLHFNDHTEVRKIVKQ